MTLYYIIFLIPPPATENKQTVIETCTLMAHLIRMWLMLS